MNIGSFTELKNCHMNPEDLQVETLALNSV